MCPGAWFRAHAARAHGFAFGMSWDFEPAAYLCSAIVNCALPWRDILPEG